VLVDLTGEELVALELLARRGLRASPEASDEYAVGIALIQVLHRAASVCGSDCGSFSSNTGNVLDASSSVVEVSSMGSSVAVAAKLLGVTSHRVRQVWPRW